MAQDFRDVVARMMENKSLAGMQPVVEKELLHYHILFALSEANLLKNLVFQGGTSLRLCHGSQRFSEDLDFSAGKNFNVDMMQDIVKVVESHISNTYDLPVTLILPKEGKHETADPVSVMTWSVRIETNPGTKGIAAQKIKIDIDNSKSHTREMMTLQRNYESVPSSLGDFLVPVQSKSEILANKLVALPASISQRGRARNRDIWDIRFLLQNQSKFDFAMVKEKAAEHGLSDCFESYVIKAIDEIDNIVRSEDFMNEMKRFIPLDTRIKTLDNPNFINFLSNYTKDALEKVRHNLYDDKDDFDNKFRV